MTATDLLKKIQLKKFCVKNLFVLPTITQISEVLCFRFCNITYKFPHNYMLHMKE